MPSPPSCVSKYNAVIMEGWEKKSSGVKEYDAISLLYSIIVLDSTETQVCRSDVGENK
jgi:hypothetical protein